jgi:hypothetical protein
MYRQDITQSVEPAMPNPERMANAIRMQGEATKSIISAAGQAYETKQFMDMRQLENDSDALLNMFTTSNMASEQASRLLPELDSMVAIEESAGPMRPEDMDALDGLKAEAQRLKDAVQGGMSNVQYETRVSDLTRKYLARYPGMSDKIRQVVGAATGLAGADRWAATQFVRERFSPKGDDGNKLLQKDFDMVHNYTRVPYETINNLYQNDPASYRALRDQAQERATLEAFNTATEQRLKGMQNQGALTVPELTNTSLGRLEGVLSTRLMDTFQMASSEGAFNEYIEQVRTNKLNPDELVAASTAHTTRMLRAVEEAHREVSREVLVKGAAMSMTKAQMDEVLGVLDRRLQDEQRLWGDKNSFVAQAIVEKNFADATFDKKFKMMQVSMQLLQFVPAKTIEAYFTNPEVLKSTNPNLYSKISESVRMADSARGNVLGSLDTNRRNIEFTVEQTGKTGEVAPPADMPVEDVKAVDEAIGAQVDAAVNKVASGGTLTTVETNYLRGLFTGSSPRGGNVTLTEGIENMREAYTSLNENDRAEVKAAASTGSVTAINNINSILSDIEKQYGVSLKLGVNDAGQIGVVNPQFDISLQNRPLVRGQGWNPQADVAAKEATKRLTPMLKNLVNTRLIVEDKAAANARNPIAKEYTDIINNKQPYNGFFSLEARPAQEAASPTRTNTTATMADVVEFATQEGMSIEEAESQLRASGITID